MRLTLTREELQAAYDVGMRLSGVSANGDVLPQVVELTEERLVVEADYGVSGSREGGTIAGVSMFRLVDTVGYMAVLAQAPKGSNGFTTDVTMQFLRPAPLGKLIAVGRPLKFGKRASIVEVTISSPAVEDGPVAHSVITFVPVFPPAT
ncbi:MAG: PaaI family thioesterase [Acidimicrobiia bacterium]